MKKSTFILKKESNYFIQIKQLRLKWSDKYQN
jgi:hypothetical protein